MELVFRRGFSYFWFFNIFSFLCIIWGFVRKENDGEVIGGVI